MLLLSSMVSIVKTDHIFSRHKMIFYISFHFFKTNKLLIHEGINFDMTNDDKPQ